MASIGDTIYRAGQIWKRLPGNITVTRKFLAQIGDGSHAAAPSWRVVEDADLLLADVTTNNVNTARHGFAPKGDGDTSKFLNANGAYSTPSGSGSVAGPGSSVDKEIVLFDGTTGDLLERATGTGIVRVASGVYGTPGNVIESEITLADNTTNDVSTTKHGFVPKAPNDVSKFLRGDATWAANSGDFWTIVSRSLDKGVNTNTTPADDGVLQFDMTAAKLYEWELHVMYSSAVGGTTPDFKWQFAGPATLTGRWSPFLTLNASDTATGYAINDFSATGVLGTATTPRLGLIKGWCYSTGGGTGASGFRFQWSQNTSNGNDTTVHAGSCFLYRQIG